jgi:heavy metal efflux system protein
MAYKILNNIGQRMKQIIVLFILVLLINNLNGQEKIKNNLTLNEAIKIGLNNNPEVKGAKEEISASKGRFWSGISLPQPELSVSYEYAPDKGSLSNYGERTFEVSQSFEFPTNYFLKGNKFNKEEEIAVCKLNLAKRRIISQVKNSYYKILVKQFQIRSAEENLVISEDFFKKAGIRLSVGEGTNLEKLTAKVQFTEALNNLEVAKNELSTAFAELNYSLGFGRQSFNSSFNLKDTLVFVDYKISLELLYKLLEETNPQIKIAELNDGIASVEKGLSWSSILPSINLAYFKQSVDGNNGFYGASFGISVPLWFMSDQKGKIQEANANQAITESELQITKNEMALRLKSSFNDYENNLKQVKLYVNDILPQAEEIYRSAIKSYEAGELTYLEYLQAKQTLINSRNNYINALFNHYQSLFQIEEMIGQDIKEKSELEK